MITELNVVLSVTMNRYPVFTDKFSALIMLASWFIKNNEFVYMVSKYLSKNCFQYLNGLILCAKLNESELVTIDQEIMPFI